MNRVPPLLEPYFFQPRPIRLASELGPHLEEVAEVRYSVLPRRSVDPPLDVPTYIYYDLTLNWHVRAETAYLSISQL